MTAVLDGVRVVEFSQNAAVPQCGRLLAGMGADVVKIEPTTGDAMRHLTPLGNHESRAYATINPGKRAMAIDLTEPDARPVVERLLAWADIALVALKSSDLPRFGLDWDRIHSHNSRVVMLQFNAYGPEGPDAHLGGYDSLVQARSGLGFLMNRSRDGVPTATRPAFVDFATGSAVCAAVLAALRHRDLTGVGQRVDASLLGAAMQMGIPQFCRFEVDADTSSQLEEEIELLRAAETTFDEQRAHFESRMVAGGALFDLYVRVFGTADGFISIAGYSPGLKQKLHDLTGLPEPPSRRSPEFAGVIAQAEQLFASKPTETWMTELLAVGYPCARYNHPLEATTDSQAVANDYVVDLDHPTNGSYRTVGMPFRFSHSPSGITQPSPGLGEHTSEMLLELGFNQAEIDALLESRVVKATGGESA